MQKNVMSRKLFFLNETKCRVYDTRITHQAPKVPAKKFVLGVRRVLGRAEPSLVVSHR